MSFNYFKKLTESMVFNERIDKELAICSAVVFCLGYSSYLLRSAVTYQNRFFAYWFSLVDNRWVSIPQSKNCPNTARDIPDQERSVPEHCYNRCSPRLLIHVTSATDRTTCWFQLSRPSENLLKWTSNAPSTRCTRCPLPISCGWTLPGLITGLIHLGDLFCKK
jgi:hypothetical protein